MAGNKYLENNAGNVTEKRANQTSSGAGDAGVIVAANSLGVIDESFLPAGVGADMIDLPCSEAIGQGKYVNIFDDAGTAKVRLADNSNGRVAFGYAKTAGASPGDTVRVYFEGPNPYLSSLTVGVKQYLGTAGAVTSTAPVAPAAQFSQTVGRATKITEINTDIEQDPIYLVA